MSKRAELADASNRLELVELSLLEVGRIIFELGFPYQDAQWLVRETYDRARMLRNLLDIGRQREARE